jgi:hypothetical protein
MEFSAFVAGGPTAALNWDQYSDAAPANAPRACATGRGDGHATTRAIGKEADFCHFCHLR